MNFRKNTIQLVAANSVQLLFGLFQVIVFSRLIAEKSDFGQLQQILLISSLLVTSLGALPNSINYFFGLYNLSGENAGHLIRRFFFVSFLLSLAIACSVLIFSKQLAFAFTNDVFISEARLVGILLFLRLLNIIYQNICLIKQTITILTVIHIFQLLLVCLVFFFRDAQGFVPLTTLFYTLILAEAIKSIALFTSVWPYFSQHRGGLQTFNLTVTEWRYIGYLLLNGALIALTAQADRVIVSTFSTPAVYSAYSLGTFANPIAGVILASLTTSFIPVLSGLFAKNDVKGILQLWKKTSQIGSVIIVPIVLFTILFGNDIIVFLFSKKYEDAGILFQIFNGRYLLVFVVFSITMNAIGLEKYTFINSIINVVTSSLLVIAGLKLYGAIGAVAGSIIAIYIGYIFPSLLINKKLGCNIRDYFPVRTFVCTMAVAGIFGLFFFLIKKKFGLSPYVVIFLIGPFYYFITLAVLNRYITPVINIQRFRDKIFK